MAAVNLILKTLMRSKEFCDAEDKNWEAVAKLIPGTTAQQCCKRWKEMQSQSTQITGFSSQSNGVQKVLPKLLQYNLINSKKSKTDKKNNPSGSSLLKSCSSTAKDLAEQEDNDESYSEKDSSTKSQGNSDIDQKSHSKQFLPQKSQSSGRESISQGPNMVIHVCDESKNLKQDFSCPRDLLIREMRYFAEYLSVEAQRWEEVDISVHCDIQIFDWLMRYVKKGFGEKSKDRKPQLEPNNVISILISSDFLKMDSLVSECIEYCHENMSGIVATPCNMNCINDKLVTRIADLYNHNELDDIKDRKDKFKSKLYCKKIEDLFDPTKPNIYSPANGSTMFKCSACKRILTAESEKKLYCVPSRLMINRDGRVTYIHLRDANWNVNDYIQGLREKLKSWKEVYWRIWGCINILYCYRCGCYFPCSELGHCRYHPSSAEYNSTNSIMGVYPCCQQRVLRFDTVGQQQGCSYRDHRVSRNITIPGPPTDKNTADDGNTRTVESSEGNEEPATQSLAKPTRTGSERRASGQSTPSSDVINSPIVVEDLYAHRNVVDIPSQRLMSARNAELDIFAVEEDVLLKHCQSSDGESTGVLPDTIDPSERRTETQPLPPLRRSRSRGTQRMPMRRLKGPPIKDDEQDHGEDEDQPESEDTEPESKGPVKTKATRKVQSASRRDFSTFKSYKWDLMRSSRWNQDAQREEDQKRMNELVIFLTNKRQTNQTPDPADKQKPKEFSGGLFSKLEHQFRQSQQPVNTKAQPGSTVSLLGSRIRKAATKT